MLCLARSAEIKRHHNGPAVAVRMPWPSPLAEHGGGSAPHADGWGIAYYREGDARLIKDTSAAHDSDWVRFVQSRGLSSTTIISHIRNPPGR